MHRLRELVGQSVGQCLAEEVEPLLVRRIHAIICSRTATSAGETSVSGQPGQGERRESATDVRLDGDEMAADADDGDAGHATGTYIATEPERWAAKCSREPAGVGLQGGGRKRPYCSESAPGSEADPRSNPDLGRVSPIGKTSS